MDYGQVGVWHGLAERLSTTHVPIPARHCGRTECDPDWSWVWPRMPDHNLWLAVTGRAHAVVNGVELPVRAGSLVVFRPGDHAEFRQLPGELLTVVWCHFDFQDLRTGTMAVMDDAWLPARHVPLQDVARVGGLLQRVIRLMREPNPLRRLEARMVLTSVLIEVYSQDSRRKGHGSGGLDARLQTVIERIRRHPEDRMSLAAAAARVDLSADYLSRMFSRQLGMSFRSYVLTARMEHAYLLVSETTMPVKAIARRLGYRDTSIFTRQFTQYCGQAPTDLRRAIAQGS